MAEDTLKDFLADQLDLDELVFRPMFGGHGLFAAGVFFGAIHGERLYFKTDEGSRPAYEARGMRAFRPGGRITLRTLYEVPVEVMEDAEALTAWAREAIACQERSGGKKKGRAARGR